MVPAVLAARVRDHLAAVALVEVHVDVGHLLATGVEEPLEQKVVLDRVEVDDAQAVRHRTAGRTATARTHAPALVLRVLDEVPHHEEVRGEAHLDDDVQLEVDPLDVARIEMLVPALVRAHVDEVAEVLAVGGEAFGQGEVGQLGAAELDVDVGPLGDPQRVVAGHLPMPEEVTHLGGRLQVVLVAVELEALLVGQQRTRLHA